jgi:Flp pilus assembly protein TadD
MAKLVGLFFLWAVAGGWAIAALVFVLVAWGLDGMQLRALPQPIVLWRARQREAKLRNRLDINPHDRSARFDLAERLVHTKRCDEALALIESNIAAGDDDVEHRLLAGMAAAGSSGADARERADEHFAAALEHAATFRSGAVHLEQGRAAWSRQRCEDALAPLEEALRQRPGSVEVRTILAECLDAVGRVDAGRRMRTDAVTRFSEAPKFERRMQRRWAWRAAPMLRWQYIGGLLVASTVVSAFTGTVLSSCEPSSDEWGDFDGMPPHPGRYEAVTELSAIDEYEELMLRGELQNGREAAPGDTLCRMTPSWGPPRPWPHCTGWGLRERDNRGEFLLCVEPARYLGDIDDDSTMRAMILFESMLAGLPPQDCEAVIDRADTRVRIGMRNGVPFEEPAAP